MYSYCYVCSVLCILFSLCCSMHCLCVNVYCTTATGCQPNCSQQIYQDAVSLGMWCPTFPDNLVVPSSTVLHISYRKTWTKKPQAWEAHFIRACTQRIFRRVRKIAKSDCKLRYIRPSAWNNSTPTGRIFMKFYILGYFSKAFPENSSFTKILQE